MNLMADLTPNDLSHLSDEEFNALAPQGFHATGPAEPLSPAAQAVLDAVLNEAAPLSEQSQQRTDAAAALRAAVDQANPKLHIEDIDYQHESYVDGWKDSLDLILVIAAELDNASTTP